MSKVFLALFHAPIGDDIALRHAGLLLRMSESARASTPRPWRQLLQHLLLSIGDRTPVVVLQPSPGALKPMSTIRRAGQIHPHMASKICRCFIACGKVVLLIVRNASITVDTH